MRGKKPKHKNKDFSCLSEKMHFLKKITFFAMASISFRKKSFFLLLKISMTPEMKWCVGPKWKQQYLLREPGWFLVGPHLLDGCWQTRFHLPLPSLLDSRNFCSQTSISLGKSSLKITYITYFSPETASSPLLSINNGSHQPLGLIAPSLKAALTLTCLFPILISSSELFCCFWLQTPALRSWGVDGLLPSSLGSRSFLPTPMPASHLGA